MTDLFFYFLSLLLCLSHDSLANTCWRTTYHLTLLFFSFPGTTHTLTTSETLTMLNWRKLNTLSRKRDDKVRYYGKQYFKTERLSGLFPKRLTSKKQTYPIQSLLLHHHIAPVRLRSYYVHLSNIRLLQITDQVGVLLPRALSPIASFHKKRWLYEYFSSALQSMHTFVMKRKSVMFHLGEAELLND